VAATDTQQFTVARLATAEGIGTALLLATVVGSGIMGERAVPFTVAAYITAAYWFTASTSFANPAVTLARSAKDTFAGIRPSDAPAFIDTQILGAACGTTLFRWPVSADEQGARR